ncbi:MAG: tyrosine-protein phosphatase [Azoarcus sp.]|jgi:protein tyrosine phosphatase (PTP) superfamily phosphohydrolase (DUF442 family)|nr:tyrosine-protein phosphatase [Azoarcus sp.]
MNAKSFLAVLLVVAMSGGAVAAPPSEERPAGWAQPVAPVAPENFYQVSPDLFRSAAPKQEHIEALHKAGIKTIMNLRQREEKSVFQAAGFIVHHRPMDAGSVSEADLLAVLKLLRASPRPALVHCWHGSDRTGFIVAGYRIVEQGWRKEDAISELRQGGFGFHELWYGNIIKTLMAIDAGALRRELDGNDMSPGQAAVVD